MIILKVGFLISYHKVFKGSFSQFELEYPTDIIKKPLGVLDPMVSLSGRQKRCTFFLEQAKILPDKTTIYIDTVEDNILDGGNYLEFIKKIPSHHSIKIIYVIPNNNNRLKSLILRKGSWDDINNLDDLVKYKYMCHSFGRWFIESYSGSKEYHNLFNHINFDSVFFHDISNLINLHNEKTVELIPVHYNNIKDNILEVFKYLGLEANIRDEIFNNHIEKLITATNYKLYNKYKELYQDKFKDYETQLINTFKQNYIKIFGLI